MRRDQEMEGEAKEKTGEGILPVRMVKRETVIVLVAVAFFLGFVLGGIAAILKTSPQQAPTQLAEPSQGEALPAPSADVLSEIKEREEFVRKEPGNTDGWVSLGDVLYGVRQYGKAIDAYTKALNIKPADPDILVKIGNSQFDMGSYEKAIDSYSQALAAKPNNADVITDMGIAYRKIKKPEMGRRCTQINADQKRLET